MDMEYLSIYLFKKINQERTQESGSFPHTNHIHLKKKNLYLFQVLHWMGVLDGLDVDDIVF